jgi:hypothetical protein
LFFPFSNNKKLLKGIWNLFHNTFLLFF